MKSKLFLLASVIMAASCSDDETRGEDAPRATLTLVRERTFAELLPQDTAYEASGVAVRGGSLVVVFDNSANVAEVDLALSSAVLGEGSKSASQYEGITIATRPAPKTYVVKEGEAGSPSAIVTIDERGKLLSSEPTDIFASADEKGLEGIAWLDDIERLLVLCEANSCGAGDESPGNGVIRSLRHDAGSWSTETTLAIPPIASFEDYSDLAVFAEADGQYRIAVVSQQSAMIWVGELTTKPLALAAPGDVYDLPKAAKKTQYCSIEGVTFLDRTTVALVSDRAKDAPGCSKAEALHVFALP